MDSTTSVCLINEIVADVLAEILIFVGPSHWPSATLVCKKWHEILKRPSVQRRADALHTLMCKSVTGSNTTIVHLRDGVLHSPREWIGDTPRISAPAVVEIDALPGGYSYHTYKYYECGKLHRGDGHPSCVGLFIANNINASVHLEWYIGGKRRKADPQDADKKSPEHWTNMVVITPDSSSARLYAPDLMLDDQGAVLASVELRKYPEFKRWAEDVAADTQETVLHKMLDNKNARIVSAAEMKAILNP